MDQEKHTPDLSFVTEDLSVEPLSNGEPTPPKKYPVRKKRRNYLIPLIFAASLGLNVFLLAHLVIFNIFSTSRTSSSYDVAYYDEMIEYGYEWDDIYYNIDEIRMLAEDISTEVLNDVALQFAHTGYYGYHDIVQLCPYLSQEVVDEVCYSLIQNDLLPISEMPQFTSYMSQEGVDRAANLYIGNYDYHWDEIGYLLPKMSQEGAAKNIMQLVRTYPSYAVEIANEFKQYLSQEDLDAIVYEIIGIQP